MATIQDIADEVGISKAAVSRILNNKGSFSQETIRKVERAARRLNYVSAHALRDALERDVRRIAVVLPPSHAPYYGLLATQIERVAFDYQYEVVLCGSLFDRGNEDQFFTELANRGVSGVFMATFVNNASTIVDQGIPVVTLGFSCSPDVCSVRSMNVTAGRLAARHLVSRGCERLLYATRFPDGLKYDERWRGFEAEAASVGAVVYPYQFSTHGAFWQEKNVMTQMLLDHPDAQGIFLESFRLMACAYQTFCELGCNIPADLKMIGHGTPELASYSGIDFSYIQENMQQIVDEAVALLVDMIENPGQRRAASTQLQVPVSLHVGSTS